MRPNITIANINRTKISDEIDMNQCVFSFSCDADIDDFEVRADGTDRNSGIVVERANIMYCDENKVCDKDLICDDYHTLANEDIPVVIDCNELTNGDKDYVINVYARSKRDGVWNE